MPTHVPMSKVAGINEKATERGSLRYQPFGEYWIVVQVQANVIATVVAHTSHFAHRSRKNAPTAAKRAGADQTATDTGPDVSALQIMKPANASRRATTINGRRRGS